jgi:DNA-3-methyladenine glycosylase
MFVIKITYPDPNDLSKVEQFLTEHRAFLNKYYQEGVFLMAGPCQPRAGGIIISLLNNKAQLEQILQEDPFYTEKVANYDLIEFMPSGCHSILQPLLQL